MPTGGIMDYVSGYRTVDTKEVYDQHLFAYMYIV